MQVLYTLAAIIAMGAIAFMISNTKDWFDGKLPPTEDDNDPYSF